MKYLIILELIQIILLFYVLNRKDKKEEKSNKRQHSKTPTATFSNPLNPYDRYKDTKSQLYEPRTPGKGIKIEEVNNGGNR